MKATEKTTKKKTIYPVKFSDDEAQALARESLKEERSMHYIIRKIVRDYLSKRQHKIESSLCNLR